MEYRLAVPYSTTKHGESHIHSTCFIKSKRSSLGPCVDRPLVLKQQPGPYYNTTARLFDTPLVNRLWKTLFKVI